jgi:hypothetical protein
MKKSVILLSLLCAALQMWAQNYQPLYSCTHAFYSYSINTTTDRQVTGIKPDSFLIRGADSILYHYRIAMDTGKHNTACSGLIFTYPSWQGIKTIIKPGTGTAVFFNLSSDSIFICAGMAMGQSWTAYTFPNKNKVLAKVLGLQYEQLNTFSDTVKTIQLNVVDIAGNPVQHVLNGKTIKLSRSKGFFTSLNWLKFPTDTTLYTLEPGRHLLAYDVYNYLPGDQFLVREETGPPGPPIYHEFTILSRNQFALDSIRYRVRQVTETFSSSIPSASSYKTDTLFWVYRALSTPMNPGMPDDSKGKSFGYLMSVPADTSCGRHYIIRDDMLADNYQADSCHSYLSEPVLHQTTFIQQEGSYSYVNASANCGCTGWIQSMTLDQYYNSASGPACGKPYELGIRENLKNRLMVYPNPASDYLILQGNSNMGTDAEVIISDLQGRELKRMPLCNPMDGIKLEISFLQAGIYTVRVRNRESLGVLVFVKE